MVYHNIINLDNMTTAIVSPKSQVGKTFWEAIQDKKRGFSIDNKFGY